MEKEFKSQKVEFSPEKNYQWEKEAPITITGEQFGLIRMMTASILAKDEVVLALNLQKVLQDIVVAKVEDGTFTEMVTASVEDDVIEVEAEEVK